MTPTADELRTYCRTLIPGYNPFDTVGDYWFDDVAALRAVEFFHECLTFTNGKWAGQPFVLQPWQQAIVGNIFGWKRPNGTRRYRKCLLFTARKSGKTEIAAGIASKLLFCDGELAPEIVSAAGNAEQAAKVFEAARNMVANEPELTRRANLFKRCIECVTNNGTYRVINAAAKTKHGGNLHAALIDELHVLPDAALVDVLETSMRARTQPLVLYTTTAGDDLETIAGEVYDYGTKVRDRIIIDDEFLPVIYECPRDGNISDPANWKLAQPNLGITVPIEEYEKDYAKALEIPRYMHVFKQLSLNQWVEAASAFLAIDQWRACGAEYTLDSLKGKPAFLGIDLSSTQDTTAVVAVVKSEGKCYAIPRIFLPRENAGGMFRRQKRDKAPYVSWINQGHIIATEGNSIDYDAVFDEIMKLAAILDIREVQMDPFNASGLAERLTKAGLTVTLCRQGWSLNQPTKELERMVLSGELIHGNQPAFTWQISSAVVRTDTRENIWLDKSKSTRRIDSAVALVMAINGAKFGLGREGAGTDESYYTNNPELIVV
jgi:phage terminase large subunit-like protein